MSVTAPRLRGPWTAARVRAHLDGARIPLRLACRSTADWPVVLSLWFVPCDGALWCATQRSARVVEMLRADGRCAFEVAGDQPPYRGVRGQATARVIEKLGAPVLEAVVDRYLPSRDTPLARWLLSRREDEVALRIDPRTVVSWDYGFRMDAPEDEVSA